jgi:hypothetical protein
MVEGHEEKHRTSTHKTMMNEQIMVNIESKK